MAVLCVIVVFESLAVIGARDTTDTVCATVLPNP